MSWRTKRRASGAQRPRLAIKRRTLDLGPPTLRPLAAVILALDIANNTGAAIYVAGRLRGFDECDARNAAERLQAIRAAALAAEVRALPVALVCEVPFGGYLNAALSLHANVCRWRDTWQGYGLAPTACIELTVGQWRRALFGSHTLTREQARANERRAAHMRILADMSTPPPRDLGGDAAAAICLGQVASRASGIRRALGCDLMHARNL